MATARVTIFYQELPPDKQTNGGTEGLRQLARHLRQSYLHGNFSDVVLAASRVEDRVTGIDVTIVGLDVLNYEPNGPRLRVGLEMPSNIAGRPELLTTHHNRFLSDWVKHHVPEVSPLLNEKREAVIPVTLRYTQVHESSVSVTP